MLKYEAIQRNDVGIPIRGIAGARTARNMTTKGKDLKKEKEEEFAIGYAIAKRIAQAVESDRLSKMLKDATVKASRTEEFLDITFTKSGMSKEDAKALQRKISRDVQDIMHSRGWSLQETSYDRGLKMRFRKAQARRLDTGLVISPRWE